MPEVLHSDKAVRVARVTARAQVVFADNPRMGRSHAVAIACHWSLWKGMIALGKRGAAK